MIEHLFRPTDLRADTYSSRIETPLERESLPSVTCWGHICRRLGVNFYWLCEREGLKRKQSLRGKMPDIEFLESVVRVRIENLKLQ